ncbi:hypothetical protein ABZ622_36505 [Streptomyces sp. NPDC007164]|uniref:hypothetical protein n=1 Tax=Streptomyces sp. NPDC007164 TaxID=3156918 RepID=UPI0033BFC35D
MSTPPADQAGRRFRPLPDGLPGWRESVAGAISEPMAMVTQDEYDALTKEDGYQYDEDRFDHHAGRRWSPPQQSGTQSLAGRCLVILNRGAISARRGLIVTGPANTGKTIAAIAAHGRLAALTHASSSSRWPVASARMAGPGAGARASATGCPAAGLSSRRRPSSRAADRADTHLSAYT